MALAWPGAVGKAGMEMAEVFPMLRHLDHLITHLGEDRVGFGSHFDGADVPAQLPAAAGLPVLPAAMRAHGYDDALMTKLCHENWLGVLGRSWKG